MDYEGVGEVNNQSIKIKNQLIENIREFYQSAFAEEEKNHFNVAVTLYFKSLAIMADLYLFNKEGKIPNNHSERFKIIEQKYPEIYQILDRTFPYYRDSYRIKLNQKHDVLFYIKM
jgi:hypothetical protein